MIDDRIPNFVREAWDLLNSQGPTYVVGGAVRDVLRGVTSRDWDLATALYPDKVMALGHKARYRVVPTGLSFGTVTWFTKHGPIDITTFRKDGRYVDGRHPRTVSFSESIEEDLSRRDFTMNAIALGSNGTLIDPYRGAQDIQDRTVVTVGPPEQRFKEDPLRMLRAVRFTAMDAAGSPFVLAPETKEAIQRLKPFILNVSGERHRQEIWSLLSEPHFASALETLNDTGLLSVLWPEWGATRDFAQENPHHAYSVDRHLLRTAAEGPTPLLRLAGLLHDIAKPACFWRDAQGIGHFYGHDHVGAIYARCLLKRMAWDNQTIDRVSTLIRHHLFPWETAGNKAIRHLIRDLGDETVLALLDLRRMDIIGAGNTWENETSVRNRVKDLLNESSAEGRKLALTGHDVMRLTGIRPGPAVGAYLRQLQEWVDEDLSRNTADQLRRHLEILVGGS